MTPLTPTNEDDIQDQEKRLYSVASQCAPMCCVVYRTKSCNKKDFVTKEIKCYTNMSLIFMDLVENIESRWKHRARICKRLRSPGIDSNESIPAYVAWRAGTKPLHKLAESIPWHRFLGSRNI